MVNRQTAIEAAISSYIKKTFLVSEFDKEISQPATPLMSSLLNKRKSKD